MRFTKYNNPAKRHKTRTHKQHTEKEREAAYILLGTAETDAKRDMIIKAFNIK